MISLHIVLLSTIVVSAVGQDHVLNWDCTDNLQGMHNTYYLAHSDCKQRSVKTCATVSNPYTFRAQHLLSEV